MEQKQTKSYDLSLDTMWTVELGPEDFVNGGTDGENLSSSGFAKVKAKLQHILDGGGDIVFNWEGSDNEESDDEDAVA